MAAYCSGSRPVIKPFPGMPASAWSRYRGGVQCGGNEDAFGFVRLSLLLALALTGATGSVLAEEFKYYVWIDDQGIVHAEEQAPKGVDYQVRVIEDINANVIPAEDFRLDADLPAVRDEDTRNAGADEPANSPE